MKNIKKNLKLILFIALCILVILMIIIGINIYSSYYKDYGKAKLSKNNKEIFNVSDLTVNNLKFGDSYNDVVFTLGVPKKETSKVEDSYKYKIMYYDGLVITMKENYDDFILVKVDIKSKKYKTNRNIKVGNKITKLFKKYNVDNSNGTYLYGNYTNNALTESEIKGNIYFGFRTSESVTYVNRESIVDGYPTNIAVLEVTYKNGKITRIAWSYDIKK